MNQFKCLIFLLIIILLSTKAKAQFAKSIATGRPGQANGPFAVGKNIYQVQSGVDFSYANTMANGFETTKDEISHNSVFRIGVKEDFELRASYNYQIKDRTEVEIPQSESEISGISSLNFGFRQFLFKQNGLIPAFGVQFTAQAGGFKEYKQENFNSELKLIANHRITDRLGLNTNLAFNWQVDKSETVAPYVLSLGYQINDKLTAVAEVYGSVEKYDTSVLYDIGLGWLLNDNFQLDIYGGYSENTNGEFGATTEAYFISSGLSYRLNRRN